MHIPDGFVSGPINAVAAVASVAALAYSLRKVKREFKDKDFAVPLMAVMAAFVFAAQMLNFPIGGGTSGHFLGAVVVATLLGPWSACIALAVVLVIQGLLFADGGISALGTNILNMGIVGGIVTYPVMRCLRAILPAGRGGYLASVAATSWFSIVLASSVCALELALSGTSPLGIALPAMAGTHALIGIGEALITTAVLSAVAIARPDIIPDWANLKVSEGATSTLQKATRGLTMAGLASAVALALFVSPFASGYPDGLEKVAEDKGFLETASEDKIVWTKSIFPDYKVQSIESEGPSTGMAGLIGTMAVFGFGFSVIRLMARPNIKV